MTRQCRAFFKTALLTFLPPMIGGLLYPNGFLVRHWLCRLSRNHLGGHCARSCWRVNLASALVARNSAVRGGKPMIVLILLFGVGNALVHILSSFNLLSVYQYSNEPTELFSSGNISQVREMVSNKTLFIIKVLRRVLPRVHRKSIGDS